MDFTYTASGSANIGGCSRYKLAEYVYYAFGIGSVVYSKPKALKGVFEKIVIKNVRFPKTYFKASRKSVCRSCTLSPLYIDTLNAYWNEEELVTYDDAKVLAEEYYIYTNAQREQLAIECK